MAPTLAANVTDMCGSLIRYRVDEGQLRVDARGSTARYEWPESAHRRHQPDETRMTVFTPIAASLSHACR
jgi:hypothetical protein